MKLTPIPEFPGMDGWKSIRIEERDEELISLSSLSERIVVRPYYAQCGIPHALNDVWLRREVVKRLLAALEYLPDGYKFVLYDGWRPLEVQQFLYDDFEQKLRQAHPELEGEALAQLVAQYVSLPNTNPRMPSPHLTGGSVDIGLVDEAGEEVDMGSPFDDFSERSNTAYYETAAETDKAGESGDAAKANQARLYRDRRRLLYTVLTVVGFTNYHKEWWHFDYGNQFWAKVKGDTAAFYGFTTLTT